MKHTAEINPAILCRISPRRPAPRRPVGSPAGRRSNLILVAGAALLATAASTQAQAWETIDDIPFSARAFAVKADAAGNIFVAGSMRDAENRPTAVVMKSADGGQTWDNDPSTPDVDEPSDAISTTDQSLAEFRAMAAARVMTGENTFEDHLVSVGKAKRVYAGPGGSLTAPWLIRRSLDHGATWQMLDEFINPVYNHLPTYTGPFGVAVDSSGNIYVSGSAEERIVTVKGKTTTTKNVVHWLIRKGVAAADGTVTWATVGDFAYPVSNIGNYTDQWYSAVSCVGTNVFVVGAGGGSWRVRKSSDGGVTWAAVDTFRFSSSDNSYALGLAADSAGNVYVAGVGGRISQNTSNPSWIVRKGSPDGTGWVTVDQFLYSNGNAQAAAVTVDSSNTVHVTGSGWTASSAMKRWITRQRSSATGLWSTTEDFSLATTGDAFGKAITADPFGNVFSAGRAIDAGAVQHGWLVRRKLVP